MGGRECVRERVCECVRKREMVCVRVSVGMGQWMGLCERPR